MTEKEKKQEKKKVKIAKAVGKNLPISTKHSIAICIFIKGKNPQKALEILEKVIRAKVAVPMKGEIPHRKNMPKGKPSGRYPIKASKYFIKLLKNLIANATTKGLDADSLIISKAIANKASRPYRGTRIAYGGKHFKRTHVNLETIEIKKETKKEKKQEKKEEIKPKSESKEEKTKETEKEKKKGEEEK